jgi:glycosyltransferase involved in cell wall biosynthesis
MRIMILADEKQKVGGNNEVIQHLKKAFLRHPNMLAEPPTIDVEYVNSDEYLPPYVPRRLKELFRLVFLRNISASTRFSEFDLVISLQPNSHCIRHKNHVIYFQHHLKQYYDLFWYSLKQKKGPWKKAIFLILAAIARMADRIYLTPNLHRSHVVANSVTVGERLQKYNALYDSAIIYPGCSKVALTEYDEGISGDRAPGNFLLAFSRLNVVQKGLDVIIAAARCMPQHNFMIAGPHDPSIDFINISGLPANVKIVVREFSEQEKAELYSSCDVFLAPYVQEDFGITPLEANAYGKPVVYCGDSGEIVRVQKDRVTGFMCQRTPASMAEGIEYCLSNKTKMAPECKENAKRYSWESFEKNIAEYIADITRSGRATLV